MLIYRSRIKTTFKTLLKILLWIFCFSTPKIRNNKCEGVTLIDPNNVHLLNEGRWCIVFNKGNAIKCREFVDCNLGLITVFDLESARLVAKFEPLEYSEVIYYENGKISSKYGNRKIQKTVSKTQIFDYFVFFYLKNIQFAFSSMGLKNSLITLKCFLEECLRDYYLF
ncbi:hypothetical protein NUSPORA_00662 [Nucleospora cyclopteri]